MSVRSVFRDPLEHPDGRRLVRARLECLRTLTGDFDQAQSQRILFDLVDPSPAVVLGWVQENVDRRWALLDVDRIGLTPGLGPAVAVPVHPLSLRGKHLVV